MVNGEKLEAALALLRAFVHRLDGLKRQRNPHRPLLLSILVLPVPNKFCHSEPRKLYRE